MRTGFSVRGGLSGRRIGALAFVTWAANCYPDHDTICRFRRENFEAVGEAFLRVLLLARELKLLKVGTVSVDSTKMDAIASKRNSIRRYHAL